MVKDYEIPLPRWELSDPFGRAALKGLRYELKKALAERDEYRIRCEEILSEQGKAVMMLARSLEHEKNVTKELTRRLKVCDEARASLGDKLSSAGDRAANLNRQLVDLREEHGELLRKYEQLQEDHEKLVRCMTDKEAEL